MALILITPPSGVIRRVAKPAALRIGQPQPSSAELLSQHGVLLGEEGDHVLLAAIDPAGEQVQQEEQGVVHGGERSGAPSAAQPRADRRRRTR